MHSLPCERMHSSESSKEAVDEAEEAADSEMMLEELIFWKRPRDAIWSISENRIMGNSSSVAKLYF